MKAEVDRIRKRSLKPFSKYRRGILLFGLVWLLSGASLEASDAFKQSLGFFTIRSQSPIQQLRFGLQHHLPWVIPKSKLAFQVQHTWKNMWLHHGGRYRIDGEVHAIVFRAPSLWLICNISTVSSRIEKLIL